MSFPVVTILSAHRSPQAAVQDQRMPNGGLRRATMPSRDIKLIGMRV